MATNTRFNDHWGEILSLTDLGRGVGVSANLYDTQIAKYQRISPTGAALVESTKRMVGGGFVGSLDTVAWTAATSGTGSASGAASSIATVTSGTSNSGYGTLKSASKSRFLYASVNNFRGTFRIPATGGTGTTRTWGAFNFGSGSAIQDGFYFSYDGTTSTLSVNSCNTGVVTNTVNSGSFNGEVKTYTLDTSPHNYEIVYQVAGVWFFVDGVLLHKISLASGIIPMSGDMALTTSAAASNSASGTTSASLEIWAMSIVRFGSAEPGPQYFHIASAATNVIKIGPGTLQHVNVNTAGSNNFSLTIYDNTSAAGSIIAIVNSNTAVATLDYSTDFSNGLTVVSAGTTPGDYTIIFD